MSTETTDSIAGLELDDNEYNVVQSLFRNKYKAYDVNGELVLQGKQKMLKLKEEFPFLDADGEPAFTVKAGGIIDTAGNYTLTDEATGEPVVVLDKNWTMMTTHWKIRDADTEALLAEIKSKSKFVEFLRRIHDIFSLIPHEHEITDMDGDHVGAIKGEFSLKDKYTITIDDTQDVPKEAIVAAAMVVDAIGGH